MKGRQPGSFGMINQFTILHRQPLSRGKNLGMPLRVRRLEGLRASRAYVKRRPVLPCGQVRESPSRGGQLFKSEPPRRGEFGIRGGKKGNFKKEE